MHTLHRVSVRFREWKKKYITTEAGFARTPLSQHQCNAGIYSHHDKTSRSNVKLRDAVEQGAACQLMLDKQYWAGGHFYLLILFSHITINRWKHQNAFRTLCEQTCFEGLGSICICPCFAEYGVLYLCLMQALIFFPPFCVSLFSLERRPISAPGSCPLRFGCGTRPCDDEAGSREMSASRGKCVSCASLTSPAARRGWGGGLSRRWGL